MAPLVASRGQGVDALREKLVSMVQRAPEARVGRRFCDLPEPFSREVQSLAGLHAKSFPVCATDARAEALLVLSDENAVSSSPDHYPPDMREAAIVDGAGEFRHRGGTRRPSVDGSRHTRTSGWNV